MPAILRFLLFSLFFLLLLHPGRAQLTPAQIDALVERTRQTFDVPGIAVAVVKDGRVVHSKGYGVRSLQTKAPVDGNTLFGIASNSKAFTAASLGLLVDEGKLRWDDKVVQYIPDFRLYNDYVTQEFTIRDLLTHRSGLGLGAGDLMFFPDSTDFTINDIIHNLHYLKPTSAFRTKYDYDNLLYMVAGEVVARVSGKSWNQFVEDRILQPLQMTRSASSWTRLKDKSNVIDAHAPVEGKVRVIARHVEQFGSAAGGLYSSVADMSKWVLMQLNGGRYGNGQQLFSRAVHQEMWNPQTILPATTAPPYNTHFQAYGLGWFMADVKGYKQIWHTGGLEGMVTQVVLLPELQLGIMVFTNQQSGAAFNAISNTIKDSYLGLPPTDWVAKLHQQVKAGEAEADKVTADVWQSINAAQKANARQVNYKPYVGTYHDNWLGDITLRELNGKLWFTAKRSPKLTGEVLPYKDQTFIVKWVNRSFDADAFMTFELDAAGRATGIKMKAISPLTDFSYDFHDLNFVRVEGK